MKIKSVIKLSPSYDDWYERYQRYYLESLSKILSKYSVTIETIHLSRYPSFIRALKYIRYSRIITSKHFKIKIFSHIMDNIANKYDNKILIPSKLYERNTGQYTFYYENKQEINICIDSRDSYNIKSPELVKWSEIFFKSNYSPIKDYDSCVVPIVNGNPYILKHIDELRAMREAPKLYDICCFIRIWGGSDGIEGIEHNIKLVESISKVSCRKFVCAYLVTGDIPILARRLDAQGIPWVTRSMPLKKLWKICSQSSLNIIRLGMLDCIPWRMMDLLAMGACPVFDRSPLTIWPSPLIENQHYLQLGATVNPVTHVAEEASYSEIPDRIIDMINNTELINNISRNTGEYFDKHASPEAVGNYIINYVDTYMKNKL
jgi:hypothetical protein